MPYYFDALTVPADEAHFWQRLEEIWFFLREDLMTVHFETREEALGQVYRKALDPNDPRFDSWSVARYRETDDHENLLHFHGLALDALGDTEIAISRRQLTAQFMHHWSVLVSSHGFIAAAMMARGDDLQSRRAGLRGGEAMTVAPQQQWFSHYFLRLYRRGHRSEAEDAIETLVNEIMTGQRPLPDGFASGWFAKLLQPKGPFPRPLTTAFRDKKLSERKMRLLAALPTDGLPPTDLKLHTP